MGSLFSLIGLLGSSSSSPPKSKEIQGLFEEIKGCNVSVANTLVDPPNGKQWLCGLEEWQPLFVRSCYAWFYDEAVRKMSLKQPKCPGLIYTGNPGIGKSSWLNYALVRFLQDGYSVVLERRKMRDYFVFFDGVCTHQEKRVRLSVLEALPENSVYLFDPDENDSHPLESNVFTIVASSPQEKHYKALFKRGANVRYFPCWELEELMTAKPVDITPEEIKERFDVWGGIARFIFSAAQGELKAKLSKAITGMDLKLVEKYLHTPEISEEDQKTISHMVVQYRIIDTTFSKCELDFASPAIGRAVIQVAGQADYSALITHYEFMRRSEWQGVYMGHLWEHLCHKILPLGNGDGLQLVPLSSDRKKNVRIIKKALEVECGSMSDLKRVLDSGKYFQPRATNFAVIDAAVKEDNVVYGFQMTVASNHSSNAHEAAQLLASFPSIHLVWVVDAAKNDHIKALQGFQQSMDPAKKVDDETLKRLQKIPQWLLKLEFPKENPFIK